MLSKTDLDQLGKTFRKIVREEIEVEMSNARTSIESQIIQSKMQLKQEINQLDDKVKDLEIDIKDVKKRVRKTEKTVDVMIGMFDKEIVGLQKRVEKVEDHLHL